MAAGICAGRPSSCCGRGRTVVRCAVAAVARLAARVACGSGAAGREGLGGRARCAWQGPSTNATKPAPQQVGKPCAAQAGGPRTPSYWQLDVVVTVGWWSGGRRSGAGWRTHLLCSVQLHCALHALAHVHQRVVLLRAGLRVVRLLQGGRAVGRQWGGIATRPLGVASGDLRRAVRGPHDGCTRSPPPCYVGPRRTRMRSAVTSSFSLPPSCASFWGSEPAVFSAGSGAGGGARGWRATTRSGGGGTALLLIAAATHRLRCACRPGPCRIPAEDAAAAPCSRPWGRLGAPGAARLGTGRPLPRT